MPNATVRASARALPKSAPKRAAPPADELDAAFPEPKAGSPAQHEDTEDYSDLEDAALDVRTWASTVARV